MAHGLTLVTRNTRHFAGLPTCRWKTGLTIRNPPLRPPLNDPSASAPTAPRPLPPPLKKRELLSYFSRRQPFPHSPRFPAMTFRQRYAQLQDASFVKRMMLRSVYGTMALENQTVPMERLEALYEKVEAERAAKATRQTGEAAR